MPLSYKPATADDVVLIFSMCKNLIDTYEDLAAIDYDKVLNWVKCKIKENIAQYTCVMLDDKKVGYFNLRQDATEAELDDFYILPEHRRRGIGTKALEDIIRKTNTPIYLYVFSKNKGAIELYSRMGFSVSEEVSSTRLIMRR